VLKGKGSWWWAGSLQQGYFWLQSQDLSLSDVVLIINDDVEFEADFLRVGLALLRKQQNTLLLAQCYSKQTGCLLDAGIQIDWQRLQFKQALSQENINCLSTRGLFLTWKDFNKIGGFHPKLLPHYTSDYEFTIRAFNKGLKLRTHSSLNLHLNELTTGDHQINSNSFLLSVKQLFSKKSSINPIFLTFFIALSCPWQLKFINWLRIWKRAIWQISYFYISTNKLS
jgi:GT2 family glycosyltransferase